MQELKKVVCPFFFPALLLIGGMLWFVSGVVVINVPKVGFITPRPFDQGLGYVFLAIGAGLFIWAFIMLTKKIS